MPAWCSSRTSSPAPKSAPYMRATSSQKCVRAGGKHNDLDNVGYTARHHTFFEMLGNFSFGDYFKEDAIALAWELITKDLGLPKDKLLVTVYHDDDEAFGLWKKIAGLSDDQHHPHRHQRQFLVDGRHRPLRPLLGNLLRPGRDVARRPARQPDEDGDRFLEFWNLVFMQFEQVAPAASASTCPNPRSTPAWGWSASPRSCRACTAITTSICSAHLIAAVGRKSPASMPTARCRLQPPHHRRPSARHLLPDRRRRAAVQ